MEKSSIHVPNHQAAINLYVNVIPSGLFFSPKPPDFSATPAGFCCQLTLALRTIP